MKSWAVTVLPSISLPSRSDGIIYSKSKNLNFIPSFIFMDPLHESCEVVSEIIFCQG